MSPILLTARLRLLLPVKNRRPMPKKLPVRVLLLQRQQPPQRKQPMNLL